MIEQQYIELFKNYKNDIDANSSKGLNKHRDAAFETFSRLGFPTSKLEDYKNTDVSRMFDADFGLNIKNLLILMKHSNVIYPISTLTFIF